MKPSLKPIKDEWKALWNDIKVRLQQLFRPGIFLYFIFVVIGVGGIGTWMALWRGKVADLSESLATGAIALIAGVTIELVLPQKTAHSMKMLGYTGLTVAGGLLALSIALKERNQYGLAIATATVLALLSWFFWILTNSENPNLNPPEDAAIGGDPEKLEIPGDLSGFKTSGEGAES